MPLPKDATLEELQIPEAWLPKSCKKKSTGLIWLNSIQVLMLVQFHTQTISKVLELRLMFTRLCLYHGFGLVFSFTRRERLTVNAICFYPARTACSMPWSVDFVGQHSLFRTYGQVPLTCLCMMMLPAAGVKSTRFAFAACQAAVHCDTEIPI